MHWEVGRAKDLTAPRVNVTNLENFSWEQLNYEVKNKIHLRRGSFKIFPESINFLEIRTGAFIISYKIVPLFNYTLLAATENMLESFLEDNFLYPFQTSLVV